MFVGALPCYLWQYKNTENGIKIPELKKKKGLK